MGPPGAGGLGSSASSAFRSSGYVINRTPLYDGLRHCLFVVPPLAVLAGVSAASYLGQRAARREFSRAWRSRRHVWRHPRRHGGGCIPTRPLYFNDGYDGGLGKAINPLMRETTGCLILQGGGPEWLQRRYAGTQCRDRIRLRPVGPFQQTQYLLPEDGLRHGAPSGPWTSRRVNPDFILTTTPVRRFISTRQGRSSIY
jgi:hypothetical protein